MECKHCLSGFIVDPASDEQYCGFCGGRLKSLSPELDVPDYPLYADDTDPVTLTLVIKNTGVVPAWVDDIKIL